MVSSKVASVGVGKLDLDSLLILLKFHPAGETPSAKLEVKNKFAPPLKARLIELVDIILVKKVFKA